MTWVVWRDAGGNLGVAAYPDLQLGRYASKALDRVVLDVRDTHDEAHARRAELERRFEPKRRTLLDQMNQADEYGSGWWVS